MPSHRIIVSGSALAAAFLALLTYGPGVGSNPASDASTAHLGTPQQSTPQEAHRLEQHFAQVSADILQAPSAIAPIVGPAGIEGFAPILTDDLALDDRFSAEFPVRGEDPIQFGVGPQGHLSLRSLEMSGPARTVGTALAYDTTRGTAYWSVTDHGYEEWLLVDEVTEGVVARYDLDGAHFEPTATGADVVDDDGVAWLEVEAPAAWSADGRAVDVWLEVDGDQLAVVVDPPDGAQGPLLVDPVWTRSDDMIRGRRLHTATRLLDGRVLVAGGVDEAGMLSAEAEIYDPHDGSWTTVAPMPHPVRSHGQVLLDDGRALILHGRGTGIPLTTAAFLYDPDADSWTIADPTRALIGGPNTRLGARAVKLPNGQILMTGNHCCPGTEAHIYDPDTDTFHPVANMLVHRVAHSLTVLEDGSVLVAGGWNPSGQNQTAELFVPDAASPEPYLNGTWVALPDMHVGHTDHEAMLLQDGPNAGSVLICAGLDSASFPGFTVFTRTCDLYDPDTQSFDLAASIPSIRQRGGTNNSGDFMARVETGEAEGQIVAAGGWPATQATEVYDPHTDSWSRACNLQFRRLRHQTVALFDGSIAVFGGQTTPWTQSQRTTERLYVGPEDDDCDGIANAQDICPTGGCSPVSGRVYFDAAEDCSDSGDLGAFGALVRAEQGSDIRYAVTDGEGHYRFDLPNGWWDVSLVDSMSIDPVEACVGLSPVYQVYAVSSPNDVDFSVKSICSGTLSIESLDPGTNTGCGGFPYRTPCPGNEWTYCFNAYNSGTAWTPGSVMTVTLPLGMDYTGFSDPNGCGLIEIGAVLNSGGQWEIEYDYAGTPNGALCSVCTNVDVVSYPPGGWVASADLYATTGVACDFTESASHVETDQCGCDPNDKGVFPAGCDEAGTISAGPLSYTVRFQNTGLGRAHDIAVIDPIDPDLDLETLYLRGTSHDVTDWQIDAEGQMYIRFEDIELPAAIDDYAASNGYIQFDIEPAEVAKGTEYTNLAEIYFDQNEVVVTNEVLNTVGVCDPPGLSEGGPSRSGLADGTHPGQGQGLENSPNGGTNNPNQAP